MKKLYWLYPLVLIAVLLAGMFLPLPMTIQASEGNISINLSVNPYQGELLPPTLDIVFNPTGTHVDSKGYLKIRLDFYPDVGDKSYESQHVYVADDTSPEYLEGYKGELDKDGNPVEFEEYQNWLDGLPHVWRVNPCLSHFIIVPSTITKAQLENYINATFHADITATIDDVMSKPDSVHFISPFMKNKAMVRKELIPLPDPSQLLSDINARLAGFSKGGLGGGKIIPIEPKSIDMGPGATVRGTDNDPNYTFIDGNNPANVAGIIDTYEIYLWAAGSATWGKLGTCYGSGTSYTPRDYESVGAITGGSKRTFTGLDIDVEAGDKCIWISDGWIYADYGGVNICLYKSGDQMDAGTQTYDYSGRSAMSVYATGTESGGEPDISNTPSSKAFGILAPSSTYWSKGSAPSFPIDAGECFFTVTNNGTIAFDISANATNWDGGVDWTLTSGSPGENTVRMSLYQVGDASGDNLTLTTTQQAWISSLAASANTSWEIKLETGTFTDGAPKTGHIYLVASAS